jgi:arabinose-5-phosphate isomerase
MSESAAKTGENVVRIEAEALKQLAARLANAMSSSFEQAVTLLDEVSGPGRVIVTGMGKSGLVGRKIAATLSSTGTPAFFLHPAEAVHGDLGMITRGDLVLALSASGETSEVLNLLPFIKRLGVRLISLTGDDLYHNNGRRSTLAQEADVALDCSVDKEACSLNLAPTASSTTMLALGDALAVALSVRKGFKAEDFANLHPGGKLGKRLARVEQLMHTGEQIPLVAPEARMDEVIGVMTRKALGIATVVKDGKLLGILSDGDLRRLLERHGGDLLTHTAAECMTVNPRTILPTACAQAALDLLEQRKITSLAVVDEAGMLQGVLHLHDLWGTEMV